MSVNVVVIVLDTTRGREVFPLDETLTPTLARLAEDGVTYSNAFAAAPWTLPSHGSLFTGTYPSTHDAHGESPVLDDRLPTLAETFRGAGYETVGISNNTWIADEFGFDRGFDAFHEPFEQSGPTEPLREAIDRLAECPPFATVLGDDGIDGPWRRLQRVLPTSTDDGASATVERVRQWLGARTTDDPFFLFVNCIEPHLEYRPPRSYASDHLPDGWSYEEAMALPQDPREFDVGKFTLSAEEWSVLRGLYRAEIAYLDEQLGRIRAALEAAGEWDDTVFVVASDHGENIGEHDLLGHQYSLYDTVLHVPLVVHGGQFGDGVGDSDALVQLTDLAPTLLDAAGIDAADVRDRFQGRSFHPSADADRRSSVFAEYHAPPITVDRLEEQYGDVPDRIYTYQRSLRAVRTDRYKYVRGSDGSERLYDLREDPDESTDVADDRPDVAASLEAELDDWLDSQGRPSRDDAVSISPATEQRLADLGYR